MKTCCAALLLMACWLCQIRVTWAATDPIDPAHLAYNLKTTVEAYEKVGMKNPKWDAEARKCLTTFARLRSWTNNEVGELAQDMAKNLARLKALGCEDPLVGYLRLRFVDAQAGTATVAAFNASVAALQKQKYPEIRTFYAALWAAKTLQNEPNQKLVAMAQFTSAASFLAKAMEDTAMPLREADQALELLLAAYWWAEPVRWHCYNTVEKSLTNRWSESSPALLARGRGYLAYAWVARGIGFADTVSETGWKLTRERLDIASQALEAAWERNPRDARICLEMLRVEQGQGKSRARMEQWFERGIKLDPGYYDLCYAKLEYLRPRWYGSTKEMIDFGRECTTNANLKSSVRLMLADAHLAASQEIQNDAQRSLYMQDPKVWSDIRFTFEQFFKLYPDAVGYRHDYAKYAYRCGQWGEFLKQAGMFPSTNHAYFGGVERFNKIVKQSSELTKDPPR
jgi:hypothetical protein